MHHPEVIEGDVVGRLTGLVGSPAAIAGVNGLEGAIGFDDAALGRHILFLGGIGTGKTVGITHLVESLRAQATTQDVFVFFDSKGDFIEKFFQPEDVSVSATGQFPGAQIWNLFTELTDGPELTEQVAELCHSLVSDVDGGDDRNKIWQNMAADLLGALITAYKRSGKPFTNQDIRFMSDALTVAQMRAIIEPHADLRGTLQYIAKDDSNTTISVLIFLQQAIRRVFRDAFRQPGEFSVKNFLRGKNRRALFLEYDLARGESLAPVYRALLDLAFRESLGRDRAAGRVFVILDEFSLLPKLTHIDAGLNFGRSLGMRFIVGTQNVGQIMQAYGDGLGGSILAGFGTVFSFRLFDAPSREYVVHRFGRNRRVVRYEAALKTRGIGEQIVEGNVIEDWDLSRLGVGQCIVGLPEGPPQWFAFAPPRR